MRRGRGKGKKQSIVTKSEDPGNGEEERVLSYRRGGSIQKPLKDEIEEVEVNENIEGGGENVKVNSSDRKTQVITENKRKRKRSVQVKEKIDPAKEENGIRTKTSTNHSAKPSGFRKNGSRRKNKPHRAAEAGVDCK